VVKYGILDLQLDTGIAAPGRGWIPSAAPADDVVASYSNDYEYANRASYDAVVSGPHLVVAGVACKFLGWVRVDLAATTAGTAADLALG
jgi:hypothetical protein